MGDPRRIKNKYSRPMILWDKERIKTYERSIRDPLTNLFTRIYMNDIITNYFYQNDRNDTIKISGIMLDIDHFKHINDTYGHLIGDCVLKELSNLLKNNFRGSDVVVRYGGEEILIIMPFTDKESACEKLENFRKLVENHMFCDKHNIKLTISAGVAEYENEDTLEELILKADRNVYFAKKHGRNQVKC